MLFVVDGHRAILGLAGQFWSVTVGLSGSRAYVGARSGLLPQCAEPLHSYVLWVLQTPLCCCSGRWHNLPHLDLGSERLSSGCSREEPVTGWRAIWPQLLLGVARQHPHLLGTAPRIASPRSLRGCPLVTSTCAPRGCEAPGCHTVLPVLVHRGHAALCCG